MKYQVIMVVVQADFLKTNIVFCRSIFRPKNMLPITSFDCYYFYYPDRAVEKGRVIDSFAEDFTREDGGRPGEVFAYFL